MTNEALNSKEKEGAMGVSLFFKDNKDFLFAIWVFKNLGWSDRRIGKLLHTSNRTITSLVERAYAYGITFKLHSFAKDEKVRIRYVGDSNNLEYLNAFLHQNPCGGGHKKKPRIYNDNWEVENND
jgi:hypothetical protein